MVVYIIPTKIFQLALIMIRFHKNGLSYFISTIHSLIFLVKFNISNQLDFSPERYSLQSISIPFHPFHLTQGRLLNTQPSSGYNMDFGFKIAVPQYRPSSSAFCSSDMVATDDGLVFQHSSAQSLFHYKKLATI